MGSQGFMANIRSSVALLFMDLDMSMIIIYIQLIIPVIIFLWQAYILLFIHVNVHYMDFDPTSRS